MKILIIKNRYKKKLNWKKGIEWFNQTPLKLELVEITTDLDLEFKKVSNGKYTGYVAKIDPFIPYSQGYDAVCLVYGNDAPGTRVSIAEDSPFYCIQVAKEDTGKVFNHELIHILFKKLASKGIVLNDPMDTYHNGNDLNAKESNRVEALKLLAPYWSLLTNESKMPKYKYFKDSEIAGLHPELVELLDKTRELAGIPFVITSGFRTKEENDKLPDAVPDSAHLDGLAADIKCLDGASRWKIVTAALQAGFKRIGIGKNFVHLDVDLLKPQETIWHYY